MSLQDEYRVVYPESVRAELQAHLVTLLEQGWDKETMATTVESLDSRLKRNPVEFGEPLFTLRAIDLVVKVGFVRPFSITFGVRDTSRTVFVRKLSLMTTRRP